MVDEVWVVTAPHAAVVRRLASRNGFTEEEAEARTAKQMSADERIARCAMIGVRARAGVSR